IGGGDHLPPIDIVELEGQSFDFVFNVAPNNGLDAFPLPWEKSKLELRVEILGDDLCFIAEFENNGFSIANDRDPVIPLFSQIPNQRAVAIRNVPDFEADTREFEDAADDD